MRTTRTLRLAVAALACIGGLATARAGRLGGCYSLGGGMSMGGGLGDAYDQFNTPGEFQKAEGKVHPADGSGPLGSSIYGRQGTYGGTRTAAAVPKAAPQYQDSSTTFRYAPAGGGMQGFVAPQSMPGLVEAKRPGDEAMPMVSYAPRMPGQSRNLMLQGETAFREGKYDEAQSIFTQADQVDGDVASSQMALMMSSLASGKGLYKTPADHLGKALEAFPGLCILAIPPRGYFGKPADYEKVLADLQAHVKQTPTDAYAQFVLSYLLWREGKMPEAEKAVSAALDDTSDPTLTASIQAFIKSVQSSRKHIERPAPQMGKPISLPWVGLTMALPAGWKQMQPDQAFEALTAEQNVSGEKGRHVSLFAISTDPGETPATFLEAALKRIEANPQIANVKPGERVADVLQGVMAEGRIVRFELNGKPMYGIVICMIRKDGLPKAAPLAYILTATTTDDSAEESILPVAAAIARSMKFEPVQRPLDAKIESGTMATSEAMGFTQLVPTHWAARETAAGLLMGQMDYTLGGVVCPLVNVCRLTVDATLTDEDIVKKVLERLTANGADPKLLEQGSATLGEKPAHQFLCQQSKIGSEETAVVLAGKEMTEAYTEGGRPFLNLTRFITVPGPEGKKYLYHLSVIAYGATPEQVKALAEPLSKGFGLKP